MNRKIEKLFEGKILFNDLDNLDETLPLQEQLDLLKEDLLQAENKNGSLLLDIGWYPEFELNGCFHVNIIKKYDWENPLYKESFKDIAALKTALDLCKTLYDF